MAGVKTSFARRASPAFATNGQPSAPQMEKLVTVGLFDDVSIETMGIARGQTAGDTPRFIAFQHLLHPRLDPVRQIMRPLNLNNRLQQGIPLRQKGHDLIIQRVDPTAHIRKGMG